MEDEDLKKAVEITKNINNILARRAKTEINKGTRTFGKDKDLKKFKCYECVFQDNFPLASIPWYPCDICSDRPTRKKDKSQFLQDYTEEQRQKHSQDALDEQENKGKFNF